MGLRYFSFFFFVCASLQREEIPIRLRQIMVDLFVVIWAFCDTWVGGGFVVKYTICLRLFILSIGLKLLRI